MESTLGAQVREILDQGGGEAAGEARLLPLVTLDSGARLALDGQARWVLLPAEGPPALLAGDTAHLGHEALEWKRSRFDDAIEQEAKALGLPGDELLFSFPVTALVRAILAKRMSYLTRLALEWLRPTELRELREDILTVTRDTMMPAPIRDFAARLVVPL